MGPTLKLTETRQGHPKALSGLPAQGSLNKRLQVLLGEVQESPQTSGLPTAVTIPCIKTILRLSGLEKWGKGAISHS